MQILFLSSPIVSSFAPPANSLCDCLLTQLVANESSTTNEKMSGYGSIPEITNYAGETAIDVDVRSVDEDTPANLSRQAHLNASTLSKLGFVFVGFVLGYVHTNLPKRGSSSSAVHQRIAKDILQLQRHVPSERDRMTKPFMDALPFEEIYPRQLWNPVQIPPITDPEPEPEPKHNTSHHKHHHSDRDLTIVAEEASKSTFPYSYLKSLLGSPASLLPTSSISKAHILYLANEAAFSLLFDSSNPKNYYLSEYSLDYFLLTSGGFDAQINQAYCAVASVAALLNSLKYAKRFRDGDSSWTFDLPVDGIYDPYPYATQNDILKGDCVSKTVIGHTEKEGDFVYGILKPPYGLNLEQTSDLIKCHTSSSDWEVIYQEVDPSKLNLSKMRYDLKAALIDPDARVVINYDRKGLNQVGGGHFSPLGAYHAATDSFLVMDVAKYKYPPVWVGADTLFDAMATVDNCGNYSFPAAQEKLIGVADPSDKEEYGKALTLLGCKQRMRGYIVLKKKA